MNIFDRLLGVIAPDICVGCGTEGLLLCAECTEKLPLLPAPICYSCGRLSRGFKTCGKCLARNKPQFVWVAMSYKDLAQDLVKAYKFESKRRGAMIIAEQLHEVLPYFADPPLVTFVPTAPQHVRSRGFDHAGLIAKELARLRAWHYAPLLVRQKSLQQHGATRVERIKQVDGAFRARGQRQLSVAHILLVDDVVTTGATLNECTKTLKEAGAKRVDAVVFARTPTK